MLSCALGRWRRRIWELAGVPAYEGFMEGFKAKLGRHSWDGSLSSPQYQIAYDKRGKPEYNLAASRELRLQLLGNSAVVIELGVIRLNVVERRVEQNR